MRNQNPNLLLQIDNLLFISNKNHSENITILLKIVD